MILNYWNIGKLLIEKAGFQDRNSTEFKRYVLQYYCSDLREFVTTDETTGKRTIGRLLKLNLDRSTGKAEFSLAEELIPASANKIMLIRKSDIYSGDPNIYGVTNSIDYILCFNLWDKLEEVIDKKGIWTRPEKAKEFKAYLESIRDTFFVKTPKGYLLNKDRIIDSQADGFPQPLVDNNDNAEPKKTKTKDLKKDLADFHKEKLNAFYCETQGFALAIDGKYLHQGEYWIEYIDFLFNRITEGKRYDKTFKGTCHLCSVKGIVGKDTSMRQKFYGSTNPLYFDGASKNRTYTSFGICKECNLNLAVGMGHAMKGLLFQIMRLPCIVLPTINKNTGLIETSEMQAVERVLNSGAYRRDTITKDIDTLMRLSEKSPNFSMLFYNKEPLKQEFVVFKLIENVDYKYLADKTQDLEAICEDYSLYRIINRLDLSLNGLRMMVLPSIRSHKLKEHKVVAKQVSQFVSDYVNGVAVDYQNLIRSFIDVWSRIEYNKKQIYPDHDLAAFILTLYLKHLKNYNQLKGVNTMTNEQNLTTQLDPKAHKDYLNYFDNHAHIFNEAEKSQYHRGLFLLGVLIDRIEHAEWKKTDKKTFSIRLNFRGISPRKVKSLYGTVEEYLKIRDVWRDDQLLAYCTESMIGIESSDLLPQEVVFYILAGKAYESYLRIYYGKNKEQEQQTQELNNGDN